MDLQLTSDPSLQALAAPRPGISDLPEGERLNTLTHLAGLALALGASAFLITRAAQGGELLRILSASVFGFAMIALYAASTVFHGLRGPAKERWAKADHCAIYVLIAGTYTPFTLVTLHGPLGWSLLGFVWCLATLGIGKELWWDRHALPAVPLYLLMGWCGLAAAGPLVRKLGSQGSLSLLAGCLCYSIGLVFYLLGRRLRHAHGIWHLFVLGGTASHFITVLKVLG
ncbi:hemolysin III family protein [Geothrix sp. PMB-07]|uniref:PAQR family membrane homeostasis protein TrhA n=1 Tax=Geothrix sp. PMB-07 TaxID=3068640 RepID=UPI0027411EA3|nr:hemolysin III family protein [Geothrix sp. PMB-07]WLT32091.1 hemolysin III family protein [Geothrix sp. PMB-07]